MKGKNIMQKFNKTLLEEVLSLPTMSFHETAVAAFVRMYSAAIGLKVDEDRFGNILVKYKGGSGRPVTFTAHMDHPGFEIVSSSGKKGIAALWGRVEVKFFSGSSVEIHTERSKIKGKIGKLIKSKKHFGKPCFYISSNEQFSKGDFGHYDLPGFKQKGDIVHARAADNLASVAAIMELMTRMVAKKSKSNLCGLFTRAEEAGFIGAFGAIEAGTISSKDPIIVMECSSAPGGKVDIGGGPVIRSGDAQSSYDPAVEAWLIDCAASAKSKSKGFKNQRALLKGGRCEACVYVAEGFPVGGLALALGNYHNHGPKGYAAEYISACDYENMILLMEEVAASPMPKNIFKEKLAPLWKNYRDLKKKL